MSQDFSVTTYPLIINQSNLVTNNDTSRYEYRFPVPVTFKNARVGVSSIAMYYSWFNITAANNNNTFSYIWTDSAGSSTHVVTFPDGYYSVADLNTYLQSVMVANLHYLINASGDSVYYVELQENSTYYSVQFNSYPLPTALPLGYTSPAGFVGFPAVASTPQLVVVANSFTDTIGFVAGTYPPAIQATTYSVLSSYTPQVSTVQSMILACDLLSNIYSNPSTVLYAFSSGGTAFGALINAAPNEISFVDIKSGQYASFSVTFLDQSFRKLEIQDTNIVIQLMVQVKKE